MPCVSSGVQKLSEKFTLLSLSLASPPVPAGIISADTGFHRSGYLAHVLRCFRKWVLPMRRALR